MLEQSPAEVVAVFEASKNLNAAFKKFLKNEVQHDPRKEKFAKTFKQVFAGRDTASKESFIAKSMPDFAGQFFILGRYAFIEEVDRIIELIIGKYADDFNSTYSKDGSSVKIEKSDDFRRIVQEVMKTIDLNIAELGLPVSNFLRNTLIAYIFEADVLKLVLPVILAEK